MELTDLQISQMINFTYGSLPLILKIVNEHFQDLDIFLKQFQTFSQRKKKAFFNDQIFDIEPQIVKYLCGISLFEDVFTRDMMELILSKLFPQDDLQKIVKLVDPYIYKSRGKYFITP